MSGAPASSSTPLERLIFRLVLWPLGALVRLLDVAALLGRPELSPYLSTWWAALVHSPYRWPEGQSAQRQLSAVGEELSEALYGETPVVTALGIFRRTGVDESASVLDLLAGRGRALFAARRLGAKSVGVELLESHVELSREPLSRVGIELRTGDGGEAVLAGFTHILLSWQGLSEATRERFTQHLESADPHTIVVAIGLPLGSESYEQVWTRSAWFSWGMERVFAYEKRA